MRLFASLCVAATLAGCASTSQNRQLDALTQAQYAYSAAIRWGDTAGAIQMLDPEWRRTHPPLTEAQIERLKQVQVTGYSVVDAPPPPGPGTAVRMIEIGLMNRNTMQARSVTYREGWRYEAGTKTWYVTTGLPDFWSGE